MNIRKLSLLMWALMLCTAALGQSSEEKIKKLKAEALLEIKKQYTLGQQINDMLFSFSELGFQEA